MAQQGLTILMDRARTGKSAALWREIAAEGLKGRQMLLVPEHASHQAERDLCRACGNRASRFTVNDPNSPMRSSQHWSYETLEGQISNLWAFSKA